MSEHFDDALAHVLGNEGGYNDIDNDKGGATNFGISLRFLQLADEDLDGNGHVDVNDIRNITRLQAEVLYREYFWEHYRLEEIESRHIAIKMLDMFVNMRGKTAAKICQRALNRYGYLTQVDGILGTKSIALINTESLHIEQFRDLIREEQADAYVRICENDPSQIKFLRGWLSRARG